MGGGKDSPAVEESGGAPRVPVWQPVLQVRGEACWVCASRSEVVVPGSVQSAVVSFEALVLFISPIYVGGRVCLHVSRLPSCEIRCCEAKGAER